MITWEKVRQKMTEQGMTSYRIKKDKTIGSATYSRLMNDEPINTKILDRLCNLLNCLPEELITYHPENVDKMEKDNNG